jgi:uncharacterized protein YggE
MTDRAQRHRGTEARGALHSRVAMFLATALTLPATLPAQAEPPRIVVSATGTVEREPDQGVVTFAVETTARRAEEAARANAATMDRVLGELRTLGPMVADLRTSGYYLSPRYDRSSPADSPEPIGYTARNGIEVTLDSIAAVGRVIDIALAAGANRVSGAGFQLKDSDQAYQEALALAVADARRQAQALAAAAGGRLGPAVRVTTGSMRPDLMIERSARARMMEAVPTPVEPGTASVTANVTVEFDYVPPEGRR